MTVPLRGRFRYGSKVAVYLFVQDVPQEVLVDLAYLLTHATSSISHFTLSSALCTGQPERVPKHRLTIAEDLDRRTTSGPALDSWGAQPVRFRPARSETPALLIFQKFANSTDPRPSPSAAAVIHLNLYQKKGFSWKPITPVGSFTLFSCCDDAGINSGCVLPSV